MRNITRKIRYRIVAQCRNNVLVVRILGKSLYFMQTAYQIFTAPKLLNGFPKNEVELISYIVDNENTPTQVYL